MGGKYQAYPEYKDSGLEWIGSLPSDWTVLKLKHLIQELEAGVSVNAADRPISEGEIGVLKTSCVYTWKFNPLENKTVFEEELSRVKCPVRYDSIVISRMNTPDLVGAAAYIDAEYDDLYLPDRLWQTVYFDAGNQCSKYLHYCMFLRGFRDQVSGYAEGASSSMQSISKEDFLSISVLSPPLNEQLCIANFLDHETAKIDTLIEKQRQLIKLLKEKRQAVISHAVTKGLNPDAPMRDSGVEWLGEVPAHWNVSKFNYEIDFQEGPGILSNDFYDEGVPLLRIQNVKGKFVSDNFKTFLSPEKVKLRWDHFRVELGDLIISCSASTGLVSEVDERTVGTIPYTGLIRLRPRSNKICKDFIRYLVQSDLFFEQINVLQTGATIQHFGPAHLQQMYITLPQVDEQLLIAEFIKNSAARLDTLIGHAEKAILLMQERRTALISAAVTGKIDVREWKAPDEQVAA